MDHRGARGCEPNTGDGAGILTGLPHEFLSRVAREELVSGCRHPGGWAPDWSSFPPRKDERELCKRAVGQIIQEQGQQLLGWRRVPTDRDQADLGPSARRSEPHIEQLFLRAAPGIEGDAFERQLYLIRKRVSRLLRSDASLEQAKVFYVCSLSTRVLVYKGMLTPGSCCRTILTFRRLISSPTWPCALPLFHQHLSQLGSCPAQSFHEPQRRNQHAEGKHQLDAGPRRRDEKLPVRKGTEKAVPHHRAGLLRLRHLRQCPGIPLDGQAGRCRKPS